MIELSAIQELLIHLGSCIGSQKEDKKSKRKVVFNDQALGALEKRIDDLSAKLPRLTTFILPEGFYSSNIHLCRTATRDLERKMVTLSDTRDVGEELKYVNRLSDYFFELARYVHRLESIVIFLEYTPIVILYLVWLFY